MLIATTETIAGHDITQTLGLVRGNTIRARHVGRDITAALRNLVGGEVTEYTKMVAESREQALDRMVAEAEEPGRRCRGRGALHDVGDHQLLAVGTAVKLQRR